MTNDPLRVPTPARASSLYREHARAVRAFVASRVRDAATVDDLVQECFVAAFARGLPEGHEGRWLVGIARNKVLHHMRDRDTTAVAEPTLASNEAGPGERAVEDEERTRVRAAVLSLDDALREVVLLRYEAGLDYQAIAEHLDLPATTVQGRLKRARLELRDRLRPLDASREGRPT